MGSRKRLRPPARRPRGTGRRARSSAGQGRTALHIESLEDRRLLAYSPVESGPALDDIPPVNPLQHFAGFYSADPVDPFIIPKVRFTTGNAGPRQFQVPADVRMIESEPFDATAETLDVINDAVEEAEPIPLGFGLEQEDAIDLRGSLQQPPIALTATTTEDDGSIPLANELTLETGTLVTIDGNLGLDSPIPNLDADFFRISGVLRGQTITAYAQTKILSSVLDPALAIYNSMGEMVAFNNDIFDNSSPAGPDGPSSYTPDSFLVYDAEEDGDYYVAILASAAGALGVPLPMDPFDSVSLAIPNPTTGDYRLTIGLDGLDEDYFAIELNAGDIVGANTTGAGQVLSFFSTDGLHLIQQAYQDVGSMIYPITSPLPTGGNASAAFVAPRPGTYFVRVTGGETGNYRVDLRLFRPVLERTTPGTKQILFLDFDGATVNPSPFGGISPSGTTVLSPLRDFLVDWDLVGYESQVIDQVVATVKRALVQDPRQFGLNPAFDLEIRNSRDDADPYGQPNVSRVVIGGTRDEMGFPTGIGLIGIAQSVDVGNFNTEETAVVLLDILSEPADLLDPAGMGPESAASLNQFPVATNLRKTKAALVGRGIGNIVAHEAGHFFGGWHTDQFNEAFNLMDQGGNFPAMIGVGEDLIFGTADDFHVGYVEDEFVRAEGYQGMQDTLNAIAFGLTSGRGVTTQIRGSVWDDRNGDGVQDAGEPPVANALVYVDADGDQRFGIGERAARTQADGTFVLNGIPEGIVTVRLDSRPGWVQTFPADNGGHTLKIKSLPRIDGVNFAMQVGSGIDQGFDYGDAPSPYPTSAVQNGPRHAVLPGFYLGESADGESDAAIDPAATGDDLAGADDEDGVRLLSDLHPGRQASVEVTITNGQNPPGVLQGWIDFDRDGRWTTPGEQIFRDLALQEGANTLTFTVPVWAKVGSTFARFRYGYERGISFTGPAAAGEVEDYQVTIQTPPAVTPTATSDSYTVAGNSAENALDVLTNDLANVPGPLTLVGVSTPNQGGVAVISDDHRQILYSPATGFDGSESFTYTVQNAAGGTAQGTVTVTVEPFVPTEPDAVDDSFVVNQDSADNILAVLANDLVPPGQILQVTAVGTPDQQGTVEIAENNQDLIYTPAAGFVGTETFTYTIDNGQGETDQATVVVTVEEVEPTDATVRVRLEALNDSGNRINSITVGQTFTLRAVVEDLRADPQGVASAFVDVEYPATLVTVAGNVTFGENFRAFNAGDVSAAGVMDEVGGLGAQVTGLEEDVLFSIPMTAQAAGTAEITTNPPDVLPLHEFALWDFAGTVELDDVEFGSLTLTIGGGSALRTNPDNSLDVSGDGSVSPLDAVLVINALNRASRQTALSAADDPENSDYFVDTNGDSQLSPVDAVLVINHLNQLARQAAQASPPPAPMAAQAAAVDEVIAESPSDQAAIGADDWDPLLFALASDVATAKKAKR